MASKNQRPGQKSVERKQLCERGHPMTWVSLAKRGRKNMVLVCECNGYSPIDNKQR